MQLPQEPTEGRAREPIVGLPCEGCEAVFEGLPAEIGSSVRIAPEDEQGTPMRVVGTVYDDNGRPADGVIVYAYHTNDGGIYPPDERLRGTSAFRHGRLRAWVQSDAEGRYRFDTIRPGSYPSRDNPEHVHMHVIEVGRCTYWINSVRFADDPLLSKEEKDSSVEDRGGSGVVMPVRDEAGVWVATRDIHLGRNVTDYTDCDL